MPNGSHKPFTKIGGPKPALGIRGRLMILALVAIVPLLVNRVSDIEADRVERIEAASRQALNLAKQGMAAQNEVIVSARAFLAVAASAQAMMTTRGERCDNFLTDAVRQAPWLKGISVATPSGQIFCSSNADAIGLNISHLPHFMQAVRTGEFAMSDYFVGSLVGPTLLTALPHRAANGSIDAVAVGPLELSWFGRVALGLAEPSGSVILMFDGSGTLLARQPSRDSWVGKEFKNHPMIRAMLESPEGIYTGECLDGIRRIFGFVQLPGTNARLAVGLDESEVLGRVNREILTSLATLGLITAIVLIGIWFGGERLVMEPIRSLTRTAQRIGQGELSTRATEYPLVAEFIPLAVALDDMAGQLAVREQELRDNNGQLQELAYIDGLTGIANRRSFNTRLVTEWQLAAKLQQPIAVLMIDVDHFKLFNDEYGHIHGDTCLRTISKVLVAGTRSLDSAPELAGAGMPPSFSSRKNTVRFSAFVARYGGEEFAVLLQGADLDAAMKAGDCLRRAVEDLHMDHVKAPSGSVTISVGVASLGPAKGGTTQQLTECADAALYEAKRRGRNVVCAYPAMDFSKAG